MTELSVCDWPRSVAWYRDALHLPVLILDEGRRFALLGGECGRVALKGGLHLAPPPGVRLSFLVDDVHAARLRLIDLGSECGPIVADSNEMFRSFRVADPDGVPVQVFAWDM